MRLGSVARSRLSLGGSLGLHVMLLGWMARASPPTALDVIELSPAELLDPPPLPPNPEPEPRAEPEVLVPPPEPTPQPPRPKKVAPAPVDETPVADEPPPRFELPPDQVIRGGESGVRVSVGAGPSANRDGIGPAGAKGHGSRPHTSEAGPPDAESWQPRGELFIKRLPDPIRVPEIPCPAVKELAITGTVVLQVQVRKDGTVRRVQLTKGMGHGCDKVAINALRQAKFSPAIATDGRPADYELRYEYVFELED